MNFEWEQVLTELFVHPAPKDAGTQVSPGFGIPEGQLPQLSGTPETTQNKTPEPCGEF